MNKITDLQSRIRELKTTTDSVILAHSYMSREIVEIADFTGDSYQISVNATTSRAGNIVLCGVRFMAETAKILNPEKRVFLPNPDAGCPMAEQLSREDLARIKQENPDRAVVAYINTTAELKELCDVCVTSSSAVNVVQNMTADKILFIPDPNLGEYVRQNCPDKDIITVGDGCPVHAAVTASEAESVKAANPNALLLVHPECPPEVLEFADFVGSTSAIMDFVEKSDKNEFIIGT
ncbi:MAG: quinolinate synthase NadA, partial [Oscillospiraceae bacterium]|nr:quinolinate synthase NadA [Oscillospiraceae bacterium]